MQPSSPLNAGVGDHYTWCLCACYSEIGVIPPECSLISQECYLYKVYSIINSRHWREFFKRKNSQKRLWCQSFLTPSFFFRLTYKDVKCHSTVAEGTTGLLPSPLRWEVPYSRYFKLSYPLDTALSWTFAEKNIYDSYDQDPSYNGYINAPFDAVGLIIANIVQLWRKLITCMPGTWDCR